MELEMKEHKLSTQQISIFVLGLLICSLGDSMNFKAEIGVSPYEATQLTAFYITGIKVGTLAIISNFILLGGQILIKKNLTLFMLLQIPLCIVQGYLLNLIIYILFGRLTLNYPLRVLFLLSGILLAGIGVGMMVYSNVGIFPLEGFCKALSEEKNLNFARVRQGADILFVVSCLLISLIFRYPFAIREGTVVAALLFSPVMNCTIKFIDQRVNQRTVP